MLRFVNQDSERVTKAEGLFNGMPTCRSRGFGVRSERWACGVLVFASRAEFVLDKRLIHLGKKQP
jgi:hypothetical protein